MESWLRACGGEEGAGIITLANGGGNEALSGDADAEHGAVGENALEDEVAVGVFGKGGEEGAEVFIILLGPF